MAYASNIDRLTDSISNLGSENVSNVDELRDQFNFQETKAQEKEEKAKDASSIDEAVGIPLILGGGGALVAGKAVAKGAEAGAKLIKSAGNVVGDASDLLDQGVTTARTAASTATRVASMASGGNIQDAMLGADVDADVGGLAETSFNAVGTSVLKQGARAVGRSFARVAGQVLPEGALKDAATAIGKTAVETGAETAVEGEIAAGTLASLDIPVLGEGLAVVGGLALIGDSIYNLFHKHHQAAPPAPPGVGQSQIPQMLTHKFSSAVPSIDTATDRSGGMINF